MPNLLIRRDVQVLRREGPQEGRQDRQHRRRRHQPHSLEGGGPRMGEGVAGQV